MTGLTEREAGQLRDALGAEQNCSWGLAELVNEQMAAHEFSEREMAKAARAHGVALAASRVNQLKGWFAIVQLLRDEGLLTAVSTPPEWKLRPLVGARRKGLTDREVIDAWEYHRAEPKKSYLAWAKEIRPDLYAARPAPKTKVPTARAFEADARAFIERHGLDAFRDVFFRVNADVSPDTVLMRVG